MSLLIFLVNFFIRDFFFFLSMLVKSAIFAFGWRGGAWASLRGSEFGVIRGWAVEGGFLLLWLGLENMAGAFEEDVEKTVTIDEYLEDVEAQELVNFVGIFFLVCFVVLSLGFD